MDYGHGKIRRNLEADRLSYLSDNLIHKIFSYIDIKHAIGASALSSRWRYIWTSMPCLNFSNEDFPTFGKFSKFVPDVLSRRNNQTEVSSINLTFHGNVSQALAKRILNIIMNVVFSHNVQQLNIASSSGKMIESPLSLFSSRSLKHLTLTWCTYKHPIMTTPTWEPSTLTTLYLHHVTFYVQHTTDHKRAGLFSNFANLKNLTLKECIMDGSGRFMISHPQLSNLTLEDGFQSGFFVTPQLKDLTIRQWGEKLMISAPELASLHYKGYQYALQLSATLHLEKADICISAPFYADKANAYKIVCLLQQFQSVKFLTLNLEIIKCLSSFVELIPYQPSPFVNLKSLMIYPYNVTLEELTQPEVAMSPVLKSYLLDGSPSATFTMVSHEEARAAKNAASALDLMKKVEVLLDQWKENTVHMEQDKAPIECHRVHIESYWKDLNKQLWEGHGRTVRTASMLGRIERLLAKLPASHKVKLQPKFSSLCAEADTIMDDMMHHMKIQCDRKPRFKSLLS